MQHCCIAMATHSASSYCFLALLLLRYKFPSLKYWLKSTVPTWRHQDTGKSLTVLVVGRSSPNFQCCKTSCSSWRAQQLVLLLL